MAGPLDDPLIAVRLKLHRAEEHLNALHSAIGSYLWRNPYEALVKLDGEAHELVVYMRVRENPPLSWSPLFGDFVHNLRSALDHLAIALVRSNKPNANISKTAFPFEKTDPFASNAPPARQEAWKRMVKGMSVKQVAAIKAVQPYNNPLPEGLLNTLSVLNDLSNADKHRTRVSFGPVGGGVVTVTARKMEDWKLGECIWCTTPLQFQTGTEVARFSVMPLRSDPDMEVDVGAEMPISVTLAEGVLKVPLPPGTNIDEVLRFLFTRVLDIVNDFAARFFV